MRSTLPAITILHLALFAALPASAAAAPAAADRPNILFLFADDMGTGDVACYGSPDVKTPQLDALAEGGARFTCFYAAGPECTPSRAALLTGRYPQRVGGLECAIGVGNVGRYDDAIGLAERHDLGLPADAAVLAPALRRAGYATAVIGKWHLGYEPKFNPLGQGFDRFFGILGGNSDYVTHRELSDLPVLFEDRRPIERDGYLTHLIADEAIRFLREPRDRPFFLYVPFSTPHFPFQGPGDGPVPWGASWSSGTRDKFVEMVEDMDRQIGRILSALERTGAAGRTLVAFASDHGAPRPGRNLPLNGFKGSLFEGGLRSPLIVRWTGRIAAGTVCEQPSITMDLTTSFLHAAEAAPPDGQPLDGIDLLQHVADERPPRPRTLFWRYRRGDRTWLAVREGDLKYVRRAEAGGAAEEWLFDLAADAGEQHNLIERRADAAERMRAALRAWEHEVRAPRLAAPQRGE